MISRCLPTRGALRAARMLGAAGALLERGGIRLGGTHLIAYRCAVVETLHRLDEAVWQAGWAAGQAMSLEQAISYALEEGPDA